MTTADFPKDLPNKLKAIRERRQLDPDQFALRVGAKDGAEIVSYEDDTGEISVRTLLRYANLAGIPFENIIDDNRDLWFGDRQN